MTSSFSSRPLAAEHVGELVRELAVLRGASVKDVQGLPPRDCLLILEPRGSDARIVRLRVSANPDAARLHVQHERVRSHEGPQGPFFQRLERELVGASVASIEHVRGDRIALIEFRETPADERRALLLELFGRHANMVLLGPDDRVLEVLAEPRGKARERLAPGALWSAPGGGGPPPAGPALVELLPEPEARTTDFPLSWRAESALGAIADTGRREDLQKRLLSRAKRKLGRAQSLVAGLEKRRVAADEAERVRMDGELLKSALGRFERGSDRVVVQDWFTDGTPEREIAVDPKKSPQDNVTRLFDRYKKLQRSRESLAAELERARGRVAALEVLMDAAQREDADAEALDAAAVERGLLDPQQEADARKRKPPAPRLPYRTFFSAAGAEIRVGRSARDNDTLTLRHCRGNDLWLHTADAPGSHIVLRLERGAEPQHEDILDAAHLAVHYSPLRGTDRADVHVARRKEVHKPRGAKPGLVHLSGGKILQVRLQPGRVEALLRSARGRDAADSGP